MKKFLCVFVLCLSVFGFAAGFAYAVPATFEVYNSSDVLDGDIFVGEDFTVNVFAGGVDGWGDLASFGFDVDPDFSLSKFTLTGYDIGDGYDGLGAGNYVSGLIDIFGPQVGNAGSSVMLASLYFSADSAGTDTLVVGEEDLIDTFNGLFYGDFFDPTAVIVNQDFFGFVDINIQQSTAPVPEPATMLLLGSGLLGMGVFKRKRTPA